MLLTTNVMLNNAREKEQRELEVVLKVYHKYLDNIRSLSPNYNFEALKNRLMSFSDKGREELIQSEALRVFKDFMLPQLNRFTKGKAEAKSVIEIIAVFQREKEFCTKVHSDY